MKFHHDRPLLGQRRGFIAAPADTLDVSWLDPFVVCQGTYCQGRFCLVGAGEQIRTDLERADAG